MPLFSPFSTDSGTSRTVVSGLSTFSVVRQILSESTISPGSRPGGLDETTRPPRLLILGVRPISPQQTSRIWSARPRRSPGPGCWLHSWSTDRPRPHCHPRSLTPSPQPRPQVWTVGFTSCCADGQKCRVVGVDTPRSPSGRAANLSIGSGVASWGGGFPHFPRSGVVFPEQMTSVEDEMTRMSFHRSVIQASWRRRILPRWADFGCCGDPSTAVG